MQIFLGKGEYPYICVKNNNKNDNNSKNKTNKQTKQNGKEVLFLCTLLLVMLTDSYEYNDDCGNDYEGDDA